ncbi:YbfA family protein [Budvicia diplopodorum]|uniref:YbfA family protein n=1 Tax=Budvicia diplopodorum TaxID=1119056 RepID=UPI00135B9BCE|nr:YbfA family protein [Budvicia diplopodorum]
MYQRYPLHRIVLRRIGVIFFGVLALPFMMFRSDKSRYYSYLHRVWSKTSTKPVWLSLSERAPKDFY